MLVTKLKPTLKSHIYASHLWDNTNLKINNHTYFYRSWHKKHINFVKDLIDENGNFLTYNEFVRSYNVRSNFLEYYGVINSIKSYINTLEVVDDEVPIKSVLIPMNLQPLLINKKGCRAIYSILIQCDIVPKSQSKWNDIYCNESLNWKDIYFLPFKICRNTKLQWFQFRINHRILATNRLLHQMSIREHDLCTFCKAETETIQHIFLAMSYCLRFYRHHFNTYL